MLSCISNKCDKTIGAKSYGTLAHGSQKGFQVADIISDNM